MHIPKTIINKLIPFFPKHPSQEILKKAKASIHKQQEKGCLEVASGKSWARVWTTKLGEEDLLSEPTQFLIGRENLENMGYQTTLEEVAVREVEEKFDIYVTEDEEFKFCSEELRRLAKAAENFPKFKDCYQSGNKEMSLTVDLLELKKIVDLAIAVAEASQLNSPTFTLSFEYNAPIYWQLNGLCFGKSPTYLADGLLMPMKSNMKSNSRSTSKTKPIKKKS